MTFQHPSRQSTTANQLEPGRSHSFTRVVDVRPAGATSGPGELTAELDRIDQRWLDGIMRDHGSHGVLAPEAIPAHMPTRHWWWWLPDDPPAH